MRTWNRACLSLIALALFWGTMAPSFAQDKKPNGKKPNGAPSAKGPVAPAVPEEALPEGVGEVGEPGVLPGGPAGIPSLEYNYYFPPPGTVALDQVQAQMYLCPSPYPPPYVGYTYITYPPFQPHEWLWIHRRAYFRVHPDGGATMTTIRWEYHDR